MGLFSAKKPAPTATSLANHDPHSGHVADPEKSSAEQVDIRTAGPGRRAVAVDPELERRVVRKLDWHIPPLVSTLFLLSFLDRGNIGNAKIAGMAKDLDLSSDRYTWLLTIFYIGYILFQFLGFMWKILPPHVWAAIIVFIWGVFSTCQAATHNWAGEMVLRFLLGVAEAGFGPSIPYLLSFFYLRHELGFRIGIFLAAAPLASTFSGALAYGITSGHPGLAKWRLLFLVEGIPTMLMAPVAFFFLPDNAAKAKFLTPEEREIAVARGVRQTGTVERIGGVVWKDIAATLMDAKPWFTALMYFSCNVSYSSLPVFLPTVIEEMGFTSVNAQGLSAPPYAVSVVVVVASAWYADRVQQRGLMIVFLSIVGGIGYILLATTTSVGPRYFGTFLAASGVFPAIANIIPWVLNNQGSDTRRGMGIVILNTIGQCGPLLGTRVFPAKQGPRFIEGQSICAAFMFFNAFLALSLRTLLKWENSRLDKKYGQIGAGKHLQQAVQEKKDVSADSEEADVGSENYSSSFRYIL